MSSLIKFVSILLFKLSLKTGSSFNSEKFGKKFKTSFLNKLKFDKSLILPSLLRIRLKIFQLLGHLIL